MLSACVSNSAHCVCCFPFHSVLYFSWHRYEHQKFWPHLRDSDYDIVGKEKGAGFNINVPWNKVGNTAHLWFHYGVFFPFASCFILSLVRICLQCHIMPQFLPPPVRLCLWKCVHACHLLSWLCVYKLYVCFILLLKKNHHDISGGHGKWWLSVSLLSRSSASCIWGEHSKNELFPT